MKNLNELIKELPDYAMGRIKDENLIRDIQYLLKNNRDFEMEFNRIKEIVGSLENEIPQSPPENYFINLIADVNNKIDEADYSPNALSRFFFNKKFAVYSAVAAVVVFVAFMFYPLSDYFFKNNVPESVQQVTVKSQNENENVPSVIPEIENYFDEIEEIQGDFSANGDELNVGNLKNQKLKKSKPQSKVGKSTLNDNELLDLFMYENDDDNNLPNEELFLKLPSDEQKNIIREIKNLKI